MTQEATYQIQYRVFWKDKKTRGSILIGAKNRKDAMVKAEYRLSSSERPIFAEEAR